MTISNSHIPLWQTIAAEEIQAIMKCWGGTTLSSLHKNGIVDYKTLRKLDPDHLDPTLTASATQRMLVKLYLVAGEMLEGERCERTQAQITQSLMRVAATARGLTAEEKEWLNAYHREVFERLSPLLDGDDLKWLEDACSAL